MSFYSKKAIRSKLFKIALCLFALTSVQTSIALETQLKSGQSLTLYGIGVHQELRNDIYVGAIFAPESVKDEATLLDSSTNKSMKLRFLTKYSNRKMARLWKQRIAMNNPKSEWRAQTKSIIQFSNLFKRAMQTGDELKLDYDASTGTSVYLNGTLFETIKTPSFFNLLLNVWFGNVPPTKAFKIGITGKNSESEKQALVSQFEGLVAIAGRFDADIPNAQSNTPVKVAKKPVSNQSKKTPKSKSPAKSQSKNQNTKKKTSTKKKSNSDDKEQKSSASKKAPPLNELTDLEQKIQYKPTPSKAASTRAKPENVKPQAIDPNLLKPNIGGKIVSKTDSEKTKKETKESSEPKQETPTKIAKLEKPKEDEFFDADLFSGSYTKDLIDSIKAIQYYPKKALIAGDEGEMTIRIKINKAGEILDKSLVERSGSRLLDRAVLRMVKKAEPFPVIPDELKTDEFEFEVPLTFTLTGN